MKVIITENYDEMSKKAAEIIIDIVKNNPNAILGLATGSSPIGMYKSSPCFTVTVSNSVVKV